MVMSNPVIKVLMVEDNPADVDLFKELLAEDSSLGIELTAASSLGQALDLLAGQDFDAVLLDLNLPDSRGLETFLQVRDQVPHLPIVVLSGLADEELAAKAVREGAQDYLVKWDLSAPLVVRAIRYAVERKQSEERLRLNEARYRAVVEDQTELICRFRPDGRLTFVNDAYCRYFNKMREELIGRSFLPFIPAEDRSVVQGQQAALGPDRPIVVYEHRVVKPDGRIAWQQWTDRAIFDDHGVLVELQAVGRDITEKKLAEDALKKAHDQLEIRVRERTAELAQANEALRKSEAQFRRLVEAMQEGLFMTDEFCRFTYVNDRFCEIVGFLREEILGSRSVDFVDKRSQDILKNQILPYRQGGHESHELTWIKPEGEKIITIVSPTAVFDQSGQFEGTLAVVTDITQRKIMENQLAQAQKLEALGGLAAGIAHEINTPTQFILSNIEFLKRELGRLDDFLKILVRMLGEAGSGRISEELIHQLEALAAETDLDYLRREIPLSIESCLEGVERVSKIVESMRYFAHPGKKEKIRIDLNQAVDNAVVVSKSQWKYCAELITDLEPDLPPLNCLAAEFNQVLLNLIINAAQAIAEAVGENPKEKGLITISTRRKGDFIEIRISDTGVGVPEEIRSKIFDPFFTTKGVGRGTGQGLAMAYSIIVEKHGGMIDLESEVGRGTTFILSLPLDSAVEEKDDDAS